LQEVKDAFLAANKDFMMYGDRVIDVTDFKHPGPQKLIEDALSEDMKNDFNDQGHSNYAIEVLRSMEVGQIIDPDKPKDGKRLDNPWHMNGLSKEEEEIHEWLDNYLDVTKPLIPQVRKLTNKQFIALVRRPRQLPGDSHDSI